LITAALFYDKSNEPGKKWVQKENDYVRVEFLHNSGANIYRMICLTREREVLLNEIISPSCEAIAASANFLVLRMETNTYGIHVTRTSITLHIHSNRP
jgi:hypothetical protein